MIKKPMVFIVLWFFVFISPSFGSDNFSGSSTIQALGNLPPEILKKLTPNEIEQLKQSIISQKKNTKTPRPVNNLLTKETGIKTTVEDPEDQLVQKNLSIIEHQYRNSYASELSSELVQFGYEIFSSATLKTSSLAVAGPDYRLGTGDQLLIRFWGSGVDGDYSAVIDKEGRINLPRIGIIYLSGLTYSDAESIIKKEAQKYIQGINLSVVLTDLRSLEVYVVGDVKNPGLHIVPSFSTIFDGLLTAGGVRKTGTLRKIELYRKDKVIKVFDLYELLLKGNRKSDILLKNRDVLFVPGIGKTAAIAGAVNNEAIFEIKKKTSASELLAMAGGILPQAKDSRIDLRRFDKNKNFLVYDLNKKSIEQRDKTFLQNGDLIEFGFSKSKLHKIIKISGHVWDEDIFQFKPGMKLSDVLTFSEILKPDALTEFAIIKRYDKSTTLTSSIRFPLSRVFSGDYDAKLHSFDNITIFSRSELGIRENISLSGAVWNPGDFEYNPGLKLKDAIALAGGLQFGARKEKVEVARQFIKGDWVQTKYIVVNIDKDGEFLLKPFDSILIPKKKNASFIEKVVITGEVAYPGRYTIRDGEKVSDLIQRAGGYSEFAYFYGAKYTSEKARVIQQKSLDQMIDKLELSIMQASSAMAQEAVSEEDVNAVAVAKENLQGLMNQLSAIKAEGRIAIKLADLTSFKNSLYDFRLKHGDTIDIPSKPSFVSVVGSVYSPGSFLYEPNQDLNFYLAKSGGIAKTADEDYMYLLKANGEILSMSQSEGFFSNFGSTVLMPGDTIVVPEDLEKGAFLKLISNLADIAFKIATTAGVALSIAL